MNSVRRFLADRQGNMAILFAVGLTLGAMVSAVAVDVASLYHERRVLQGQVDLAAISAAQDPSARVALVQSALSSGGIIDPAVSMSAYSSHAANPAVTIEAGRYVADSNVQPYQRFSPGSSPINAVRVRVSEPGTLRFANGWIPRPALDATAVAVVNPQVSFSVGSRLASLNQGIANSLLNTLLGSSVALTAVDYNGLATAKVDAFAFLDALAMELGITVGTYDDILAAKVDHGKLAAALARVLSGPQRAAAQKIANATGHNGRVPLRSLIDLGELGRLAIGSGGRDLNTDFSALELLSVSAALSDGIHQANLVLSAGLPGLTGLDVSVAIGEPPQGDAWFTVGPLQSVTRTAQIRLKLEARLLGGPILLGAGVRLPLYLEVAPAEAIVASATCPTGNNVSGTASILVRPGVARLVLGEVNATSLGDFNTQPNIGLAKLIDVILLKVTGKANAEIAQTTPIVLNFSASEIAAGTRKTARTSTYTQSLFTTLLGDLQLNVAGLSLGVVTNALKSLFVPLTPTLDLVIDSVLKAVGISLGEADVQVYGVRCSQAVLVG